MAAKPLLTDLPRFVATGAKEAPLTDIQDAGYPVEAKLPREHVHWQWAATYAMLRYMWDGVLSGDHSIAGNLTVNDGNLSVSGTSVLDDQVTVNGDAQINGALTGTGNLGFAGNLTVGANAAVAGTLGVVGVITGTAGFVASGTSRYKHGARTVNIDASAWVPMSDAVAVGASFSSAGYWSCPGQGSPTPAQFRAPLYFEAGKRITVFTQGYDVGGSGTTLSFGISRRNLATGATNSISGATISTALGSGYTTTTAILSGGGHQVEIGYSYYLTCTTTNSAQRLWHSAVDFDEP